MNDNLRNCASGNPKFVAKWHEICDEFEENKRNWIAKLREAGFKACHPSDGWIDRVNNKMQMVYPLFNDGLQVGDLMMIGADYDKKRPVRITEITTCRFSRHTHYHFEDIENSPL